MDLRMPGMNGEDAARAIKMRPGPNQSIPILGFSANTQVRMETLPDFRGLVSRPVLSGDLIEAIASHFRNQAAPTSVALAGAA